MSGNLKQAEEKAKKEFLIALGKHIKKTRQEKGLSAAEFGRRAFLERSHIARLEGGNTNPTATTLRMVCKALKIEFDELFEGFELENNK